jgi:hypothetical protein
VYTSGTLMRAWLVGVALSFAGVAVSHADYLDWRLQVTCDAKSNRVEITPYAVYNQDVYSAEPQDCTLATGRTVRAKMGIGPAYPYGMGGADPDKWVSVWVDKSLVLSRESFGCADEGPCGLRVLVTFDGMKVCRPTESADRSQRKSAKGPVEQCEFTPNSKLTTDRDAQEFPSAIDRQRPPAGSIATLFAKNEEFCSLFPDISGRRIDLPGEAEPIEADASPTHEHIGGYERYTFDINNDGKADTVIGLHSQTHYRDGDIYFVYSDGSVPQPTVDRREHTQSELVYAKAATRILPHYWADYTGAAEKQFAEKDRDDAAYVVKSVGAPWWDSDDKPVFRFRYLYLRPFRYQDSTYFLTSSQEADARHWYTVLRPEPDFHVTEMCVFQIVRERY